MDNRIITAVFAEGERIAFCPPLYQFDYGQELVIEGLELPTTFEVHFASDGAEESYTSLYTDGSVTIPDICLRSSNALNAWVVLHDTSSDGETEYKITIPVIERAEPSNTEPTPVQQDIIEQAIAALNEAVSDCEEAVTHYPKIDDETGNWNVWDGTVDDWSDTGVHAQGEQGEQGETGAPGADGFSPSASVSKVGNTATITITDKEGTTTAQISDGESGARIDDSAISITKTWSSYKINNTKMDKTNPTGTGSLSMNRKSGTTIGNYSTTEGNNCEASGSYAHAGGQNCKVTGTIYGSWGFSHGRNNESTGEEAVSFGEETKASGSHSFSHGYKSEAIGDGSVAMGWESKASGARSFVHGYQSEAKGEDSFVLGGGNNANGRLQVVFGEGAEEDVNTVTRNGNTGYGNYVEIVGNGYKEGQVYHPSNARTLDWSGNEILAGKLTIGGTPTENNDVVRKIDIAGKQDTLTAGSNITISGSTISATDTKTFSGMTDTNFANLQDGQIAKYNSASQKWVNADETGGSAELEKNISGSVVSFNDGADDLPVIDLVAQIVPIQSGTGDPSPSNVRPISGYTGVNVKHTKKNLCPVNNISGATWANTNSSLLAFMNSLVNGRYTLSMSLEVKTVTQEASVWVWGFVAIGGSNIDFKQTVNSAPTVGQKVNNSITFEIDDTNRGKFTAFYVYGCGNNTLEALGTADFSNIQFEVGTTATTFEPYSATTYSVTWQTEAGTVYGGTIDLTTGLLTVIKKGVDLGTLSWTYASSAQYGIFIATIPDMESPQTSEDRLTGGMMCEQLKIASSGSADANMDDKAFFRYNNHQIVLRYIGETTSTIGTTLNGVKFVYPLATPQTYQLTPTEVKTLLGVNNIFADTGDVSVTYRTKMASDIVELVETEVGVDDLANVDISTPTDGQVLKYNGTSGKWENGNVPTPWKEFTFVAVSGSTMASVDLRSLNVSDSNVFELFTNPEIPHNSMTFYPDTSSLIITFDALSADTPMKVRIS